MGSAIPGVDYHTLLFPLEFISFQTDDLLETEFLLPLRNLNCFCIIIFPTKKAVLTSFLSSVRSCLSDSFQIHWVGISDYVFYCCHLYKKLLPAEPLTRWAPKGTIRCSVRYWLICSITTQNPFGWKPWQNNFIYPKNICPAILNSTFIWLWRNTWCIWDWPMPAIC